MNDQPKVPAQIEPYVRVLGVDGAVEFLLSFGGAELYIPRNAKGKSMVAKKFGSRRRRPWPKPPSSCRAACRPPSPGSRASSTRKTCLWPKLPADCMSRT